MATLRFCTGTPVTSRLSTWMVPEVGWSRPAISRISEVLPESVGPSRILRDPAVKVRDTSLM
ncbi:MAG: hypothetical protein ACD_75C00871G0001 [uncultured bacterium]|nr:MAG: hypothetical protein ACD_75C00871G0001 [uncultured bacterium]